MLKKQNMNKEKKVKVTFVVAGNTDNVSVVGDFNQWDPSADPLKKRSNGTRSASVVLEPNQRYAFRYYKECGEWFNDEAADEYVVNDHGGEDCVVTTF
ncbi:MAG: isoamylase early set domain-containing protein [Caldilineaceae bacterium]|nr:isoamylase early set domain-containing protein [Caldilineaceae bacterium]MCB9147850.1 isoamylase early set domain-containing protein [Caldilineaceae bacterium]